MSDHAAGAISYSSSFWLVGFRGYVVVKGIKRTLTYLYFAVTPLRLLPSTEWIFVPSWSSFRL
ncbi:hypothetical protein V8F33_000884 [Rhypophila sp. PSN 637]